MPIDFLIALALVQGITEFLPISSSGHLILLPRFLGEADQGLLIDVALHVGTLGAVVLYFWREVRLAFFGLFDLVRGQMTEGAKLALLLVIATIPVIVLGLVLKVTGISDQLRSIAVIGWSMLVFGIVLWWFDSRGAELKKTEDWSIGDAVKLGVWQAVALIPGTSRSGACITGARALGYDRTASATIAMLMSIPTILASGALLGLDLISDGPTGQTRDALIAAGLAFVSALVALVIMMRLLKSVSFLPYVIYRVVFGIILLGIAYL